MTDAAIPINHARRWNVQRLLLTVLLAAFVWLVIAALCTLVGSTGNIGWPSDRTALGFRSERVLVASLVGAGLGMAGVVY